MAPDDDLLAIIDDDGETAAAAPDRVWRILVVDDDDEVHASTAYSLNDVEILDRKLSLAHAKTAAEALALLRRDGDFAVILLDVVMETPDAGLRLVKTIREELGQTATRIILRTGQPGYAPEMSVVRDYDINDYRTKSELTRGRLLTSLYAALRAYNHIYALEISRKGLAQIIAASAGLFRRHSLGAFCDGLLLQLSGLLGFDVSGFVLARTAPALNPSSLRRMLPAGGGEPVILTAAGAFRHLAGAPLSRVTDDAMRALLRSALDGRANIYQASTTVLYIPGQSGDDLAIYVAAGRPITAEVRQLLEIFSSNVALGFDNVSLLDNVKALAYYDPLTGLPNRALFLDEIAGRLNESAEPRTLAVLLLDLDHFQTVNDGLGHAVGDALLLEVSRRLREMFDEPGAVSRIAGDMFGVLAWLRGPQERLDRDLKELIHAVEYSFQTPFVIDGAPVGVRASGGYVLTDAHTGAHTGAEAAATDAPLLQRRAGMALKKAKRGGRGVILQFDPAMEHELHRRMSLVSRMQEAQSQGQFSLAYQPQLQLADGAVFGVEALLRWRLPDGAAIGPDHFIPAAEESGHIIRLGEWALRQACRRQAQWRDQGVGSLRMAVNVSVRQLLDGDFARVAERVVSACDANPADIELEITESHAMENDQVLAMVRRLRDMGFSIAIDDFGTGYSSLSRLRQLPASTLKIDRSFVADVDSRPESRNIAATIIRIGHEFGMQVLAEGVETAAQEETLRALGCDAAQGYFYARPMPPDDLEQWMRKPK